MCLHPYINKEETLDLSKVFVFNIIANKLILAERMQR